ncbi:hypothetical protein RIR_jg38730.t1 [Rhizophagus irregularis DAOM 181602=DAOM 197198]|nr:hypothetical protein RIR_jg38730.t1 [Rhizophagus irregularis DAOM 181602=DAOM 197198]
MRSLFFNFFKLFFRLLVVFGDLYFFSDNYTYYLLVKQLAFITIFYLGTLLTYLHYLLEDEMDRTAPWTFQTEVDAREQPISWALDQFSSFRWFSLETKTVFKVRKLTSII